MKKTNQTINLSESQRDKIRSIWEVFAWLDHCRWEAKESYNLINYAYDDLSPAEKILTHWLSYITDRQMRFRRIWEVGGYVFSTLVRTYTKEKDKKSSEILSSFLDEDKRDAKLRIPTSKHESELLKRIYGLKEDDPVQFKSRYGGTDLTCVLRTLTFLESFNRSIVEYISNVVNRCGRNLDQIAVSLHGLTYLQRRRIKNEDFCREMMDEIQKEACEWREDLKRNTEKVLESANMSFDRYQSKRLWCALRDYVKSPEFSVLFADALNNGLAAWWRDPQEGPRAQMHIVELPGDVWNNSEIISKLLLGLDDLPKTWKSPRIVRALHNTLKAKEDFPKSKYYPEQFDVTFDFVPRMCENRNCNFCFFGPHGVEHICNPKEGNWCSVALGTCGYHSMCEQEKCMIFKNQSKYKGYCDAPSIFGIN